MSYDMDEVAEKIADQVLVDVRVMQLRQAKQDLVLLRHEEDDEDDASGLQLNLFGEGRLVDYDPLRLVLGQDAPCIGAAAAHQARYHRHTQTWGLLEPRKCCVACGAQALLQLQRQSSAGRRRINPGTPPPPRNPPAPA